MPQGTTRRSAWTGMLARFEPPQAADARRLEDAVELWGVSRRWALAVVVACFPLLMILDGAADLPLSPVLPGLLVLVLVLLALPLILQEALHARLRRTDRPRVRILRMRSSSRLALGVAVLWFIGWLMWGA